MSSYDQTFERAVKERVKDERQRHVDAVLQGLPQEAYQREVGSIAAFDELLKIFEEVQRKILNE